MTDHDFNRAIVNEVAHRPWPLPDAPWVMRQTVNDLLFAHWPVRADAIRDKVPAEFTLDVFDGTAWLAIVPFHMTNAAPRGVPSLPWISEFAELNVRTYVRVGNKPGIYFFSLDAGSALAVRGARILLNLPFYSARINVSTDRQFIQFESRRYGHSEEATLLAKYRGDGSQHQANPGSLEYFLTERYCLYNLDHQRAPYRLDIHHPPWALEVADADLSHNTMADAAGVRLSDTKPLLHYSVRQDMVAWPPCPLAG